MLTFPMVLQNPTAYIGFHCLSGEGSIIEIVNQSGAVQRSLYWKQRWIMMEMPEAAKYSHGRFIAKTSKFLDPEIYKKGKKITLAGEIIGKETKPLGKGQYIYPVVMIKELHLWKKIRTYAYPP